MISDKALVIGGGLALGAALAYVSSNGIKGVASNAVGLAADTAAGVVIGVGEVVGIPETNAQKCQQAMLEGNTMDASFYCPAPTFLKYLVTGKPA